MALFHSSYLNILIWLLLRGTEEDINFVQIFQWRRGLPYLMCERLLSGFSQLEEAEIKRKVAFSISDIQLS